MRQTSNFKLAYSAEALSAAKAGQTSNKFQIQNFSFWCLMFDFSLVFGVCFLNFGAAGALL